MTDESARLRNSLRAPQPWGDARLARLYDAFPFDDDLPLYLGLAEAEGGNVLEVGCGSGRVLVPLARAGFTVAGVDISPPMLDLAREKLATLGNGVDERVSLVQADMSSFSLGRRFDLAIVAVKSMAYLVDRLDQQKTLSNIASHLRPGGLLALDLLNPSPAWLQEPAGSLRQDLAQYLPETGETVARTETAVSTDLAAQVRVIRSAYEVIAPDGTVTKRLVEWPYRYLYRFEAEHLLERSGFAIEALYGGYRREPFTSDSRTMLFLARAASTR